MGVRNMLDNCNKVLGVSMAVFTLLITLKKFKEARLILEETQIAWKEMEQEVLSKIDTNPFKSEEEKLIVVDLTDSMRKETSLLFQKQREFLENNELASKAASC
jgi:hypothetical protein